MKGFLAVVALFAVCGRCCAESASADAPVSSVPAVRGAGALPAPPRPAASPALSDARNADARPASASILLSRSSVCTAIQDREPVGAQPADQPLKPGMVYFWTEVKASAVPTTVRHRWTRDGRPAGESALSVKHPKTRTWSMRQAGPGDWKVEALSAAGELLGTATFKVGR